MSAFSEIATAVELYRDGLLGGKESDELIHTLQKLGYSIEDLP